MNDTQLQLEVMKRAPLLDALREQPMTMGDLDEAVTTSRSTIHRALGTFEDLNLVRKSDQTYELTEFGCIVTDRTSQFRRNLATARRLDEFLNAVNASELDIPVEYFADAEVIRPEPRKAHRGVKRIIDHIRSADSLLMFSNVLSPLYADVAREEMIDGMELEVVFDERIMDLLVSEYADDAVEAFETGRFDVYFGPDIPFELFISEDSMAMAAHNHSTLPRMFVKSDSADAIAWAEELYARYRDRAEPFDPGDIESHAEAEVVPAIED